MSLYAGLMSGTSMDGVDAVLAEIGDDERLRVVAHAHRAMPVDLAAELFALNSEGFDELRRAALAANALARLQAHAIHALLERAGVTPADVRAVGSHGQTVRHRPREFDDTGFTLQLNNGALLAELSGIDVVCDFRSRDLAAGGEGAPLVPAFHQAQFGSRPGRAVLNVGGIANLTLLGGARLGGFDCGPGNALMDLWTQRHLGQPFDADGAWAAGGRCDATLLARLLSEPYFAKSPPKSTGRDLFNAPWLAAMLGDLAIPPVDVQATLLELTARAAIDALRAEAPGTSELLVCGGGAHNLALMTRLATLWPGLSVASTDTAGMPPTQVEAAAFAWLAHRFVERRPGNHPGVTGAAGLRILGALYPAD